MLRLQQGENLPLNVLMTRYKHRLFAFICRYTGREETAYDILQETFIKLYFAAASYQPRYKFSTWLFQIALNLCRDHYRKARRRQLPSLFSGSDPASTLPALSPNPEEEQIARSELAALSREVERLPHTLKSALVAFAIEDRSQEESAGLLGITPKTLEMRVYRARKLLARRLGSKA